MITPIQVPRHILGLHSRVPKKSRKIVILQWLKDNGAPVADGETVLVLDTRKATVEMVSPASGLLFHLVEVDVRVNVGDTLAVVAKSVEEFRDYLGWTVDKAPLVLSEREHL
ncbi:MAG: lipoyl domain-containing protein [Syntrophobacteraceae bacterium]|nr:lipoyl domain-containing protein [Syntrophobacteraceae bacterium]